MAAPVPVVLDCDPGHDDMVAIVVAAADPRIDLLAVTTVAGNAPLAEVTRNALAVCALAGIDVPVAAGAAGPLVGELRVAEDIHGPSGLEGAELPDAVREPEPEHAVELLARVLGEHPEPVTLVPTGPLTNVALLLRTHPELAARIARVVLMGGSAGRGNVTPLAEFNIAVDLEAANVVLSSGLDVTVVGLDVTHQALATPAVLARLTALGTPLAATVVELLGFFAERYETRFGMPAPPLHDPVALARVIDPALVPCVRARVDVELRGTHTRGATVCDLHGVTGREPNAWVATGVDVDGFWELVVRSVAALGAG